MAGTARFILGKVVQSELNSPSALGGILMNGCPTHGWSVIASASMDSQLAGVLAGFVFTGIVLLFGRHGPKNIQALGLFCAAFVALGFDSYLFGELSGGISDPFCVRIWTEEMTAAGMLAVGAM